VNCIRSDLPASKYATQQSFSVLCCARSVDVIKTFFLVGGAVVGSVEGGKVLTGTSVDGRVVVPIVPGCSVGDDVGVPVVGFSVIGDTSGEGLGVGGRVVGGIVWGGDVAVVTAPMVMIVDMLVK
jgi:hypothetical protein